MTLAVQLARPSGSFDFEDGTNVAMSGIAILDYDSDEWSVSLDTSNMLTTGEVSLSFTMIPEPSTATLSLLALTAMLARRRRKVASCVK